MNGIRAYDLTLPTSNPFTGGWQPLRHAPTFAEAAVARHRARERQAAIQRAAGEAQEDWERAAASLAGNPVVLAALGLHKPVAAYFGVECAECCDRHPGETQAAAWQCGTYAAMKAATDGRP